MRIKLSLWRHLAVRGGQAYVNRSLHQAHGAGVGLTRRRQVIPRAGVRNPKHLARASLRVTGRRCIELAGRRGYLLTIVLRALFG